MAVRCPEILRKTRFPRRCSHFLVIGKNICDDNFFYFLKYNCKGFRKLLYYIFYRMKKDTKMLECVVCDFSCFKQSNFNKHLLTGKHHSRTQLNKKMPNGRDIFSCKTCKKIYKARNSLWYHEQKCNENTTVDKNIELTLDKLVEENITLKQLMLVVINNNNDLQKQNNETIELQKQMVDVCKNISTINNTTNINQSNSHNKTFNLQFFLNEQCKDAMNISDFANSFDLQLSDFESVGELGYVEGITKIMLDKLNSMDIYKRPIHCSDAKREIIYVKDHDVWEKEERNNPKLRYAIKTISFNNMKLMGLWSSTYPESMDGESRLNDKYMVLIKQSTGGNGEISVSEDKIIRRIAKEILIGKHL